MRDGGGYRRASQRRCALKRTEAGSSQAERKIRRRNDAFANTLAMHERERGVDHFGCIQHPMMAESLGRQQARVVPMTCIQLTFAPWNFKIIQIVDDETREPKHTQMLTNMQVAHVYARSALMPVQEALTQMAS